MTVPKRRLSKMKGRKRRTHYVAQGVTAPTLCDSCRALIAPHQVCPYCGDYRGKKFLVIKHADAN